MSRGDTLRLNDWFCGAGGATQGAHAVPGVVPVLAANHDQLAIETHSTNFPDVEHFRGDIRDLDVARHPYAELFWASPECTFWSQARGEQVDYDKQPGLFGDEDIADAAARSRALMPDTGTSWFVDDLDPLDVQVHGWVPTEARWAYRNRLAELGVDL